MRMITAVRDRAIDAFGIPIFVLAQGEALRSFMDEINRPGSPFNAHPDDYDLYLIGAYDETTGEVIPETPRMICVGKEVYKDPSLL